MNASTIGWREGSPTRPPRWLLIRPALAAVAAAMSLGFGSPVTANQAEVSIQIVDGPTDTVTDTNPPLTVNLGTTFGPTGANLATGFANTFQAVFTGTNLITHTHTLRAAAEVDANEAGSATVGASVQIEQGYRLVVDPGMTVDMATLRFVVEGDGSIQTPIDAEGTPLGSAQVSASWLLWMGDPDDPGSILLDVGTLFQDNTGFGAGPPGFDFASELIDQNNDGTMDALQSIWAGGTSFSAPSIATVAAIYLQADLGAFADNDDLPGVYSSFHVDTLNLSLTSLTPGVTLVAIPEPAAATLLALPLAGLLAAYRRRG